GLFSRRGYNIASLAVSTTQDPDLSRMTIVVDDEGDATILEQISKQLYKLVDVIKVFDHTEDEIVESELSLIKVGSSAATRAEIMQLADIFRARIVDVGDGTLIVEATGKEEKIDALVELLQKFGIEEMVRTGKVVLVRGPRAT
ncbi:MAG: acetolactate synthase small subunit, partial [Armatimonadota bacterium]